MEITNKPAHDPVTDLHMTDAYMRWALLAAEEVAGKQGVAVVLRQAGLGRFIDHYPPNELKISGNVTFDDYANLSTGLLNFFGRAGKSMTLRIGRVSAKLGIEQQSGLFGIAAIVAIAKVFPFGTVLMKGLEVQQNGLRKLSQAVGETVRLRLEDRGDKVAYIYEDCPFCAGKHAPERICWIFNGILQESTRLVSGKEAEVEEVECRAMGAPACVWEISKTPKT
jgi:predicted hydrocarbon binding protein